MMKFCIFSKHSPRHQHFCSLFALHRFISIIFRGNVFFFFTFPLNRNINNFLKYFDHLHLNYINYF